MNFGAWNLVPIVVKLYSTGTTWDRNLWPVSYQIHFQQIYYTCGFVLTCMQIEEFEMHASTKIIVVTGFTTELHAGRQRVHFSILQPFLLTTYGNNRRLEDIVSDK